MLWKHPSKLSQEMVSCMMDINCHLVDPLEARKHISSDNIPFLNSPLGHISMPSISDSSILSLTSPISVSKSKNPHVGTSCLGPYGDHNRLDWGDIGRYGSAVEVSGMWVGKEQLEYAAEALRLFRHALWTLFRICAYIVLFLHIHHILSLSHT
ncbi:hypothetical protein KP509_18G021800 [Ceratopteris richardii]|nr:hypothetical protein KP509_18G021800 [Ceratopteris richardii]